MNEIFYSICFPYALRLNLLRNTLQSFREQYSYRRDYSVSIAIDPISNKEHDKLVALTMEYIEIPIILNTGEHRGISYLRNLSVNKSTGKYIIHTSPEVLVNGDILSFCDDSFHLDSDAYLVFAVNNIDANGKHLEWYQHSVHKNHMYHFLTAMSRETWFKTGGFCEEFDSGYAWDDNDYCGIIKSLGIKIVTIDEVWGSHQSHPHVPITNHREMSLRNRQLFLRRESERTRIKTV